MNLDLLHISQTEQPLVRNMTDEHRFGFKTGLVLLANLVGKDFLDMNRLTGSPGSRSGHGLVYQINYLDQPIVTVTGNHRNLITVYDPTNQETHYPMRIDISLNENNSTSSWTIRLQNDMDPEADSIVLMQSVDGRRYTSDIGTLALSVLTLSQLYTIVKNSSLEPHEC